MVPREGWAACANSEQRPLRLPRSQPIKGSPELAQNIVVDGLPARPIDGYFVGICGPA